MTWFRHFLGIRYKWKGEAPRKIGPMMRWLSNWWCQQKQWGSIPCETFFFIYITTKVKGNGKKHPWTADISSPTKITMTRVIFLKIHIDFATSKTLRYLIFSAMLTRRVAALTPSFWHRSVIKAFGETTSSLKNANDVNKSGPAVKHWSFSSGFHIEGLSLGSKGNKKWIDFL